MKLAESWVSRFGRDRRKGESDMAIATNPTQFLTLTPAEMSRRSIQKFEALKASRRQKELDDMTDEHKINDDTTSGFPEPFPLPKITHYGIATPDVPESNFGNIAGPLTPQLDARLPDDSELPPLRPRQVVVVDRELIHQACDHLFALLDHGGTQSQQVEADQFAHRHGRTVTRIMDDAGS